MAEDYIKFSCERRDVDLVLPMGLLEVMNRLRSALIGMGYLGVLPPKAIGGVGYGNISLRSGEAFYITGSATGHLAALEAEHVVLVERADIAANRVRCSGRMNASSETLSHAAVYQADPDARLVVHFHSRELWLKHIFEMPTTPVTEAYGSPGLAKSVGRLVQEQGAEGLAILGGHEDGILAWAPDPERVLNQIQGLRE